MFGMINLRTDGERAVIAQKLEERQSGTGEEWDIHRFERREPGGPLQYQPKHRAQVGREDRQGHALPRPRARSRDRA